MTNVDVDVPYLRAHLASIGGGREVHKELWLAENSALQGFHFAAPDEM